ncbi:transporter, SSS family [Muriicola jejuensis]|uniref:Sodium:solute symporter n=1 Tax=Muriicola jejuensis TaxID=504488 RepID=A0A6P0UE39_9FLAO|nr:sodium:solute symporter family protein [Muriicola jejuensis]NER10169.1 sodium:solute symporter [Muriicola jejuensis]SMP02592.1 transporter, SSS family [Muriicola jejuensis]
MITSFIILYLLLTLGVGFWASRRIKTSDDFTLAGKSLSTSFVGVTLFATWFGSSQIMGNPSRFVAEGFTAFFNLVLAPGLCLLVVGIFYARKLYRMNIVTVGDFFKLRYNKSLEVTSSILMVVSYPHWIAAQFVALAYLFNAIIGVPLDYGIFLGAVIVIIYTYIGGMWAVSYTDMIQSIMILLGLIILLTEVLQQAGGIGLFFEERRAEFYDLLPTAGIDSWSEFIALFLAFAVGPIPVQEIYQRVFSARNEKAARNGLFLGAFLMVTIPSIPLLIGLGGAQLYPELMDAGDGQEIIPAMVLMFTSTPVQILFYGAMISAILSTSSGAMLAPATVIGENLIKTYARGISDRRLLLYTRLSVVVVAAFSCYFAFSDIDIVGLVAASLALILVCLFAPFTFGLFWKKASVAGAWAAVITGGFVWFFCYLYETRIDATIYGFVLSCLAMVIGSLVSPDKKHPAWPSDQVKLTRNPPGPE